MAQTITDRLIKTQTELSRMRKEFNDTEKRTHNIAIEAIARETEREIDELKERIRKANAKDEKRRREENERFEVIEQKFNDNIKPLVDAVKNMEDSLELYSIKNNLEKTDKVGWMDSREVQESSHHTCKMLDLAAIHVIIGKPRDSYRRKVNKFNVRIRVVFFNHKLKDMFEEKNIINWDSFSLLADKPVPGLNAGMDWLAKNYDKSVAPFIAYHDELMAKMNALTVDPVKEFDFRTLEMNVSHRNIIKQTKNNLVVSYEDDYPYRTILEITHVGQLSFNLAMRRDVDDKKSTGDKTPEELAIEILNTYHALGLRKEQVKFYAAKPKHKMAGV